MLGKEGAAVGHRIARHGPSLQGGDNHKNTRLSDKKKEEKGKQSINFIFIFLVLLGARC